MTDQGERKKQLESKVDDAYERIKKVKIPKSDNPRQAKELIKQHFEQMKPTNNDEAYRLIKELKYQWAKYTIDLTNFTEIKHYLDDDYPGDDVCDKSKNLRIIAYAIVDGEDRFFMPEGEDDSPQYVLETLKKYDLIPEDCHVNDYSFLFPEVKN